MAQDPRVKQELIRRAQDYYRQSLTRAVTATQYGAKHTARRRPLAPDLDQMLRMMLVREIQGKVKDLQPTPLLSPADVSRKFSHPLSIERKAVELQRKLPEKRKDRKLSYSVEIRKTPSPTFPPSLRRPITKDFTPILHGRKSPEVPRKASIQPSTPAGLSLQRLYSRS